MTHVSYADRAKMILGIRAAQTITILSHYNPDPDAYGSLCGLALSLRAAGKTVSMVNESGSAERLSFIPGVNEVSAKLPHFSQGALLIACDCGSFQRLGDELGPQIPRAQVQLYNIDHHISNDGFGDLNWVETSASSTSEMILDLLDEAGWAIPVDAANALYVGILGDTGSFRYSSTTAKTFRAATRLVECGARPDVIARQLFGNQSLKALRLQSEAMSTLQLHLGGRLSVVQVPHSLFLQHQATQEDVEGMVDKARDIEGVEVAAAITEYEAGLWKVGLRAKTDTFDLNRVAAAFGGGGHRAAAAFRSRKSPEIFFPELLRLIEEAGRAGNG